MQIQLVRSNENKADEFTRVPRKRLDKPTCSTNMVVSIPFDKLPQLHDTHHLGVDRTFHLAKSMLGSVVTRKDVEQIVNECHVCRRIDPAPVQWETGQIDVGDDWYRLATDITHYNSNSYLTIIDCGPSRYVIWRKQQNSRSFLKEVHP